MSQWICCNSCFASPGSERQLAVSSCGHVVCNVCFHRGQKGVCVICKARCQISPLCAKSSSEVQALFSDINTVAVRYFSEICKVLQFQARHQKRLLAHCQQKIERLKEAGLKMQQEMQKVSKKMAEQKSYISKLETTLQHQRLLSQSNRDLQTAGQMRASSITNLLCSSPLSVSPAFSRTSLAEGLDSRGLPHKPDKIRLISSPEDACRGSAGLRASDQRPVGSRLVPFTAPVRQFSSGQRGPAVSISHNVAYRRGSPWETPVFKLPSAYKYPSVSSLGPPP